MSAGPLCRSSWPEVDVRAVRGQWPGNIPSLSPSFLYLHTVYVFFFVGLNPWIIILLKNWNPSTLFLLNGFSRKVTQSSFFLELKHQLEADGRSVIISCLNWNNAGLILDIVKQLWLQEQWILIISYNFLLHLQGHKSVEARSPDLHNFYLIVCYRTSGTRHGTLKLQTMWTPISPGMLLTPPTKSWEDLHQLLPFISVARIWQRTLQVWTWELSWLWYVICSSNDYGSSIHVWCMCAAKSCQVWSVINSV